MTDTRKVALADEEIGEAAAEHCRTVQCDDDTFPTEDFIAGARFARDFYEEREVLWRELNDFLLLQPPLDQDDMDRIRELRAALGLERE